MNSVPNVIACPVHNFSPSLWGNKFLDYTFDDQLAERYFKAIKALKVEVKTKLTAPESKTGDTMNLIDKLERLGISYHFENEIEENLQHFFDLNTNYEDESYDLYTVSLHFRLFRQHGYRITSGIFSKFHDLNGNFHEDHKNDARGLLSFFEAAQLRINGEKLLEDALIFAKDNLRCIAPNLTSPLIKKQVENALEQQLHLGFPRLESLKFVSIYEEDEFRDESLLKFAKLDYNALQMRHRQELSELSRWWKELDLVSKLPYTRDRLVEVYFATLVVYSEPQYSRARAILTKVIMFGSLVDDTYDNYGTVEELKIFTQAIERWDASEIDRLPEYMKPLYRAILKFFEQLDEKLANEARSYAVDYAIGEFKELVRGYYVEAKWFIEGYLPSFAEYQSNGLITIAGYLFTTSSLLGVKSITKKDFELLKKKPRMLVACAQIGRFLDDIASYQNEKERGQLATGVECYMKENGVTKDEAMNKFLEITTTAWMEMNEEYFNPSPYSENVKKIIFGLARTAEVAYKNYEDGYTKPEKVWKRHITSLLVDPLKI